MRIADAQMQLSSTHSSTERHQSREHLQYWTENEGSAERVPPAWGLRRIAAELQAQQRSAEVEISARGAALQARPVLFENQPGDEAEALMEDLEFSLLKSLVEKITGRELKLFRAADFASGQTQAPAEPGTAAQAPGDEAEPGQGEGWGLVYDYYESHYEAESTAFRAEGLVRTADGKEIRIDVQLNMSREFFSEQSVSLRAGDALKDPLVIDFSGTGAQLTQNRFAFDLDQDGREDQIAFVRSGSGFLALDKNGDGRVTDGGELFGPRSGDGFAELAAYDGDGNGWIDENDAVYSRLRIWSKDADGADHLVGLGQRGVGAIYLGRVETPFALKDGDNNLQGQVTASGVYLREDGGAGVVQQLDLKV